MKAETDAPEVLAIHRKVVEDEVAEERSHVTGLMMAQGTSVLHFLEGPSTSIQRILTALANSNHFEPLDVMQNMLAQNNGGAAAGSSSQAALPGASTTGGGGGGAIQTGRIVYSVEDRPQRLYPDWYSSVIAEKKSGSEDVNSENCKDIVFDLSSKLLELGKRITKEQHRTDLEISRYAEHLPSKALILALSNSEYFCTLQEFIESYILPYHIELESEQTWPLEPIVKYY